MRNRFRQLAFIVLAALAAATACAQTPIAQLTCTGGSQPDLSIAVYGFEAIKIPTSPIVSLYSVITLVAPSQTPFLLQLGAMQATYIKCVITGDSTSDTFANAQIGDAGHFNFGSGILGSAPVLADSIVFVDAKLSLSVHSTSVSGLPSGPIAQQLRLLAARTMAKRHSDSVPIYGRKEP